MQDNCICGICGKPIDHDKTTDHIIPRAIAKWSGVKGMKKLIEKRYNTMPAHKWCNLRKEDSIPNVDELHISTEQKEKVFAMVDRIQIQIQEHVARKEVQFQSQGRKCYQCGREIKSGVLRRIDPKKPRDWDTNACVVCTTCNKKCKNFLHPQPKKKITQKVKL